MHSWVEWIKTRRISRMFVVTFYHFFGSSQIILAHGQGLKVLCTLLFKHHFSWFVWTAVKSFQVLMLWCDECKFWRVTSCFVKTMHLLSIQYCWVLLVNMMMSKPDYCPITWSCQHKLLQEMLWWWDCKILHYEQLIWCSGSCISMNTVTVIILTISACISSSCWCWW